MKRLTYILCSLVIFFAGAAAVWADCARISLAKPGDHHAAETRQDGHSHHSDSGHEHSHDPAVIHCPTLDEFFPTAAFSTAEQLRVERAAAPLIVISVSDFTPRQFLRSHGPPGLVTSARIPQYISLSVLRV
jgi:hypothetical protein